MHERPRGPSWPFDDLKSFPVCGKTLAERGLGATYPWQVLDLMETILKEEAKAFTHPTATIHPTAVITGDVYLDERATVMEFVSITGPAYIGKDCVVKTGSIVRGGSAGDRCVIGQRSEIKGCALHSDVWTHGTYLGDSVVGNNVSFGTGSVTANLRLDEGTVQSAVAGERTDTGRVKFGTAVGNDVRFGMQVGINPGVKVGRGTMVAACAHLTGDVADESFVTMKNGHMHERPNATPVPPIAARDKFKETKK